MLAHLVKAARLLVVFSSKSALLQFSIFVNVVLSTLRIERIGDMVLEISMACA